MADSIQGAGICLRAPPRIQSLQDKRSVFNARLAVSCRRTAASPATSAAVSVHQGSDLSPTNEFICDPEIRRVDGSVQHGVRRGRPSQVMAYSYTTDSYTLVFHTGDIYRRVIMPNVHGRWLIVDFTANRSSCRSFIQYCYRAMLCVSAVFAVGRCPSIRPSVSLSVTFGYCRLSRRL